VNFRGRSPPPRQRTRNAVELEKDQPKARIAIREFEIMMIHGTMNQMWPLNSDGSILNSRSKSVKCPARKDTD
jgi:hypothetical protein